MTNQKVVWKDGMFILPHHFQQLERYVLHSQGQSLKQTGPFVYGFTSYQINTSLLVNGTFKLDSATGVFPDATPFSLQVGEELPAPRSVLDFITDPTKPLMVYLSVPASWPGKAVYTDTSSVNEGRFVRSYSTLTDEETGTSREEVEVARLNTVILFEGETREGYVSMPIAKVRKLVSGAVEIVEAYVPPLLKISASKYLADTLRSIASALRIRGTELMRARKEISQGMAEFPPEELTSSTLLQIIATYLPQLEQYLHILKEVSPFEVNGIIAQLTGALSMFKPGDAIISLPSYEHENIAAVFDGYKDIIESVVAGNYAPNSAVIEFEKRSPVTYECPLDDSVDLTSAELYIGITADIGGADLSRAVENLMKVSSNEMLPRLTMSAMPGLQLSAVHNPSQKMATKDGFIYFAVNKSGEHWSAIVNTRSISLYFPSNFENLAMHLLVSKGEA